MSLDLIFKLDKATKELQKITNKAIIRLKALEDRNPRKYITFYRKQRKLLKEMMHDSLTLANLWDIQLSDLFSFYKARIAKERGRPGIRRPAAQRKLNETIENYKLFKMINHNPEDAYTFVVQSDVKSAIYKYLCTWFADTTPLFLVFTMALTEAKDLFPCR